ncbi:hypothetical protein [Paenibacillus sp. GCM10028914]|uniref:hypothetical protein n=1 Tax=Paenibacillus sp. GCM10028914 TaxID=3273416 RepID=UPI0036175F60
MREMDISQFHIDAPNKERISWVKTSYTSKKRSDTEKVLLMRSARNQFIKAVEEGKIVIHSKTEWTLN